MNEPGSWEDAHQLLKWLERLPKLEFDGHLPNILEIGCKGRKMVRIIPLP